jgi:PAS domain S-box-containing protein
MHAKYGTYAAFSLLAFCGNYFSLQLFGTVSLVFGSIIALSAIGLLGLIPAMAIAVVGASYTLVAWGHPYAVAIFALEVLFVGIFSRRSDNIALVDAAYWACIGVPLVLLTYWGVMGIPLDSASFIGLKQAVNGVLNAVVAGLIMGFLPTLAPPARRNLAKVSFDALLFHVLAFVALTTSLVLTLAESRAEYRLNLDRVSALLNALGAQTQHFSMADHYRDEEFRRALVPMLGSATGLGLEIDDIAIARARPDGSHEDVLGATRTLDVTGTATQVQPGVWRWSPTGPMPELSRLNASVYFARVAAPDVEFARDVWVELSAEPITKALESSGRRNLLLLAASMLFVLMGSKLLVRQLTAPLARLASATEGLPRVIAAQGDAPYVPASAINEYDRLATSFREMACSLGQLFRERDELTRTLEARVEQRTRQLSLLSQVARQTTNGVVVTDLEGRVTWINEAFEAMTGYDLDEMRGKVPGKLLQRSSPPVEVVREMREGLRQRRSFHVELLNHTKDGRPYWIELRCNPLSDANGEHMGFIAIENDVTDRMNIQRALQESLERLQLATEVAEMRIWAVDHETGQIEWNERNFRLHGIAPDRDVATEWLGRVHPEDVSRIDEMFCSLLEGHSNKFIFEFRLNHSDRGPRVLSSIARAIRENGKVVRVTGVTRDITHERQASEELRRSVQHTEAILNNVVDAIITIDKEGQITSSNTAAERIFGYSVEQMNGKNISVLMTSDNAAQHDHYIRSYLAGAQTRLMGRIGTFEAVRANGEIFPVEITITKIEVGDSSFLMVIIRDVTERKRIERMQSEFLATVNHELRTPLTSIRGTLSLLHNGVLGQLEAKGERIVAAAIQNAEQLGQMVEEMLDLERLRQGKLEIQLSLVALQQVVDQAIEMNRVLAGSRDIDLISEPFGGHFRTY